jgi:hypothetical protein
MPLWVRPPSSAWASPKSVTNAVRVPSSACSTSTFPGFMSRWTSPCKCAACRPVAAWRRSSTRSASVTCAATSPSVAPRTSWKRMQGRPPSVPTSSTRTTWGCSTRAWKHASSSSRSSACPVTAPLSKSFTATGLARERSHAAQTSPMPPRPRSARSSTRPSSAASERLTMSIGLPLQGQSTPGPAGRLRAVGGRRRVARPAVAAPPGAGRSGCKDGSQSRSRTSSGPHRSSGAHGAVGQQGLN